MAQKDEERPKIRFCNIRSDMKAATCATARVSTRPAHQVQFHEGSDKYVGRRRLLILEKILERIYSR